MVRSGDAPCLWVLALLAASCAANTPPGAAGGDGSRANDGGSGDAGHTDRGAVDANSDSTALDMAAVDTARDKPGPGTWPRTFGRSDEPTREICCMGKMLFQPASLVTVWSRGAAMDFDPGPGTDYWKQFGGAIDTFIVRMDPDGTYRGTASIGSVYGHGDTSAFQIADTGDGGLVIAGTFAESADFDPGAGVTTRRSEGGYDAFVVVLGPDNSLRWVRTLGGKGDEAARDMTVAPDGSVFIAGYFEGVVDFDPGPGVDVQSSPGSGSFVVKLTRDGDFAWSRTFAISDESNGWISTPGTFGNYGKLGAFEIDAAGDGSVRVAGTTALARPQALDFDPGPGIDLHTGLYYLTKLGADGSYGWTRLLQRAPSFNSRGGNSIAVTEEGAVFLAGGLFGGEADFDPGPGTDLKVAMGSDQGRASGFLTRFEANGDYGGTTILDGGDYLRNVFITLAGELIVTGRSGFWVDFDPGPDVVTLGRPVHLESDSFIVGLGQDGSYRWSMAYGASTLAATELSDGTVIFGGHISYSGSSVNLVPRPGIEFHDPAIDGFLFISKFRPAR